VEVGLGKKTAEGIQFTSMAIGGFVLAFFYEPLYTLVLIATTPVLALCGSFLNNVTTGGAARIESAYSRVRCPVATVNPSTHPPSRRQRDAHNGRRCKAILRLSRRVPWLALSDAVDSRPCAVVRHSAWPRRRTPHRERRGTNMEAVAHKYN
jgi:hypothetical protein